MDNHLIGIMGGLGHIGLIQAACLAKLGYKTVACDQKSISRKELLDGVLPFYEPGLAGLVKETVKNGYLTFTSRVEDLEDCNFIFICVGTPFLLSGETDTSQVYLAVSEVARKRKRHCLIIIKSTVPVGTNRNITAYLEENNLSERATLISSPEFLREGSGVNDFWNPERIIVGARSKELAQAVVDLYRPPGVPVIITSWENAEIIKYASNAFLANKISFINEISNLCEAVGADIRIVSKGVGLDSRINRHFLDAGIGFSGPCLEKDLKSLLHQFQKIGKPAKLLDAVLKVNEEQRLKPVQLLQEKLGKLEGRHIAVLGLAFKPETDDIRDSHSLVIIKHLLSLGAVITVHDPYVKQPQQAAFFQEEFCKVNWASSPYEAIESKEAVLILTAWPQYYDLDLKRISSSLSYPLMIDGRNLFDKSIAEKYGIIYLGVGI